MDNVFQEKTCIFRSEIQRFFFQNFSAKMANKVAGSLSARKVVLKKVFVYKITD